MVRASGSARLQGLGQVVDIHRILESCPGPSSILGLEHALGDRGHLRYDLT